MKESKIWTEPVWMAFNFLKLLFFFNNFFAWYNRWQTIFFSAFPLVLNVPMLMLVMDITFRAVKYASAVWLPQLEDVRL